MKFFIDTANLDQIREAQSLGVLDGVTTNPSLMAKEGITGEGGVPKFLFWFETYHRAFFQDLPCFRNVVPIWA